MLLPADRADASSFSRDNGNFRASRHFTSSTPTAPVAPTTATEGEGGSTRRWFREASSATDIGLSLGCKPETGADVRRPHPFPAGPWINSRYFSRATSKAARKGVFVFIVHFDIGSIMAR